MTQLEQDVADLRAKLDALAERVRLDAVAQAFIDGNHEIREGDYFIMQYTDRATRLLSVSSEGKWTYNDGHSCIEPYRIPQPGEHTRLYTIAEVAEIVAKVRAQ